MDGKPELALHFDIAADERLTAILSMESGKLVMTHLSESIARDYEYFYTDGYYFSDVFGNASGVYYDFYIFDKYGVPHPVYSYDSSYNISHVERNTYTINGQTYAVPPMVYDNGEIPLGEMIEIHCWIICSEIIRTNGYVDELSFYQEKDVNNAVKAYIASLDLPSYDHVSYHESYQTIIRAHKAMEGLGSYENIPEHVRGGDIQWIDLIHCD